MSRPLKGALFVEGDAEEAAAPILLDIDQHLAVGHCGERTHQPVLTAMLDFAYLCHEDRRAVADAVGFGPLHRACHFLADSLGQSGAVYPPANSAFLDAPTNGG